MNLRLFRQQPSNNGSAAVRHDALRGPVVDGLLVCGRDSNAGRQRPSSRGTQTTTSDCSSNATIDTANADGCDMNDYQHVTESSGNGILHSIFDVADDPHANRLAFRPTAGCFSADGAPRSGAWPSSSSSSSHQRTAPIRLPEHHVPRTDSELQFEEDKRAAEIADLVLFHRIADGIRRQQQQRYRHDNHDDSTCIDNEVQHSMLSLPLLPDIDATRTDPDLGAPSHCNPSDSECTPPSKAGVPPSCYRRALLKRPQSDQVPQWIASALPPRVHSTPTCRPGHSPPVKTQRSPSAPSYLTLQMNRASRIEASYGTYDQVHLPLDATTSNATTSMSAVAAAPSADAQFDSDAATGDWSVTGFDDDDGNDDANVGFSEVPTFAVRRQPLVPPVPVSDDRSRPGVVGCPVPTFGVSGGASLEPSSSSQYAQQSTGFFDLVSGPFAPDAGMSDVNDTAHATIHNEDGDSDAIFQLEL